MTLWRIADLVGKIIAKYSIGIKLISKICACPICQKLEASKTVTAFNNDLAQFNLIS